MTALIAVPVGTAEDLSALARAADLHEVEPYTELVIIGADGQPIDLPRGARLAVRVSLRVTRTAAQERTPTVTPARPRGGARGVSRW
jgi:hypothetical protein